MGLLSYDSSVIFDNKDFLLTLTFLYEFYICFIHKDFIIHVMVRVKKNK